MARGRRDPCFFKVLLGDHYSQKLRIPGAFLKYFYGKIPKQLRLQTPAGTWHVDVEKVDNKFYIQKGWEKFVRENGIRVNEFVVFRYTENSEFSVDIYGTNMCKKLSVMASGCPRSTSAGIPTGMEEANEEDDPSVDILGDVPARRRSRGEYDLHNENDENEYEEESGEDNETEDDVDYEDKDESGSEEATENEDEDHNDDSDDSSVEIVSEFPSCLKPRCKPPLRSQLRQSKLTSSTAKAQRNMNDVCGQGESYQKLSQNFHRSEHRAMAAKDDTLRRANVFVAKSVYPCCVIPMRRSYATGSYLNIPTYFAKRYLKKKPIHIIFRTNGHKWPVKLDYPKQARVVGGWYTFARFFELEENDVCVFVLTNTINISFDVEIFRITEAAESLPVGRQAAATQRKSKYGRT